MSFSENRVGKAFEEELKKHEYLFFDKQGKSYSTRFKVYLNKHVPTHTQKFKQFWRAKNLNLRDIPPAQPEMDIIMVDKLNIWHAIELKAIKKTREGISPSYYLGLGQTLAYLSFGFNEVAIWQCFDGTTLTDDEIQRYDSALSRIRNPLSPLVGKTCFRILTDKEKLRIQTSVWNS